LPGYFLHRQNSVRLCGRAARCRWQGLRHRLTHRPNRRPSAAGKDDARESLAVPTPDAPPPPNLRMRPLISSGIKGGKDRGPIERIPLRLLDGSAAGLKPALHSKTGRLILRKWAVSCTNEPAKNRIELTTYRRKPAILCKIALDST